MTVDASFWRGRRVFLTGHTGFKGGWLSLWLQRLGAELQGFALEPPTPDNLFTEARVADGMASTIGDIRDLAALQSALAAFRPEVVIHMAAQPLVRLSYAEPVETYATNVMGTVHLLESVRRTPGVRAVVSVTTDKCYENREWAWGYRENEPMGGHDPYSNSKGCAELVTSAYRRSFFEHGGVALASARAGNVIGGGDWAEDRLVPDAIRALAADKPIPVRNPAFTRPWQHVLEPLGGYLLLGAKLEKARRSGSREQIDRYAQAFNFGPDPEANRTVRDLVEEVLRHWPGKWEQVHQEAHLKEAPLLSLAIDKARAVLGWAPQWHFPQTVQETVSWYRTDPAQVRAYTQSQIRAYTTAR